MPTMGWLSRIAPVEPYPPAPGPKGKMPPSLATSQYPSSCSVFASPAMGRLSRMPPVGPKPAAARVVAVERRPRPRGQRRPRGRQPPQRDVPRAGMVADGVARVRRDREAEGAVAERADGRRREDDTRRRDRGALRQRAVDDVV